MRKVWIEIRHGGQKMKEILSPSVRKVWIEIPSASVLEKLISVTFGEEGVD